MMQKNFFKKLKKISELTNSILDTLDENENAEFEKRLVDFRKQKRHEKRRKSELETFMSQLHNLEELQDFAR